jgi:exonuclease VII small subunit
MRSKDTIIKEEDRKSTIDLKAQLRKNKNLEDLITTLEREKARLTNDLKRYTKGAIRSNIMEAELFRRKQLDMIA